jgi:tetratricopeptide (TPR) repeat protein
MPYFGGASLSQVLDALREVTPVPTRGEELVGALDAVSTPDAPPDPACGVAVGSARQTYLRNRFLALNRAPQEATPDGRYVLSRLSYVQAAMWVVARLAEGLHHAHQRGVLHRDIKPSNILLGGDGQPMLLDFNLSLSDAGEQAQASLGGTVAYMSPEHLRALASRDPALARTVDQRSDIYALGMVLFEMLAGHRPFDNNASYAPMPVLVEAMALERGRGSPSLRAVRPDVSWGLESVLRRCLDPDPECRYRQAEELAEDLRRLLDDRPLRHAPELSRAERLHKWARRHPRVTSAAPACAAALLLLFGAAVALTAVRSSLVDTQAQLGVAHAQDVKRDFEKGSERALFLLNTTNDLEDHLRQGLTVSEETLGHYGVLDRLDWEVHPDWQRLGDDDRRRLVADVRELLVLLAGARVRLAPHDHDTLTAALAVLDMAEAVPGLEPCRALWEDRAAYYRELGDATAATRARAAADKIEPKTARDYYLLGMTFARERRYAEAVTQLNEALRLNPRDYWACMQRGLCHQENNDPVLAAADFGACVGLEPDFAWGYFNRGYALSRCGRRTEALAEYTSALRCDADLLPAYLNRGLLRLEAAVGPGSETLAQQALDDFQQVVNRGRDDAALHSGRGVALERLSRHAEADVAFALAQRRAAGAPPAARIRLLWVYGFAVAARLPDDAREAFETVLTTEPHNAQALYGCGMLLMARGRSTEALSYFDRAVAAPGDVTEARRFRAILLARLGRFAKADVEMQKCLDADPSSGAIQYAAACVAALSAREDPREVARAVEFLREAFKLHYGRDQAATDPDLTNVRGNPEFRRLLQQ